MLEAQKGWRVLAVATALLALGGSAHAQIGFYGNIVDDNGLDNCDGAPVGCGAITSCDYLALPGNDEVDPMLTNPFDFCAPSWVPMAGSPALSTNDDVWKVAYPDYPCSNVDADCPGNAQQVFPVCYRGAVPPASSGEDWTATGWVYVDYDGCDCDGNPRTDIDFGKPLVVLQGQLDTPDELNLTNESNYLIRGRVFVDAGDVLNIGAGTVLFGEQATAGFMVIERGAKINAIGTATEPIIMTSDATPCNYARGGWGGLVIHGRAIANCADCLGGESCASEGGTAGFFCGDDDCDDSGELRYVRVEYAGVEISQDNELNAFTFNGLGAKTKLSYLQAHMGFDDNFEWFGGKVHADHLVSTGSGDDGIDWQMGFRGSVQFAVDQHYDDDGDKAIEADNNEFDNDAVCRSNPVLANLTLVGPGPFALQTTDGINLRRGTDAQIFNSIVMGWPEYGIQFQGSATCARGISPDPGIFCGPNVAVGEGTGPAAQVALRAFPNPVARQANFAFNVTRSGRVHLGIYDISGRLVDEVVNTELTAGAHEFTWNVPDQVQPGVYFYRYISGAESAGGRFFRVR